MSGDSVPLPLPLARLANGVCEATALYRELRKPLLRYLVCLGLSMRRGAGRGSGCLPQPASPLGLGRIARKHSQLGISCRAQSGAEIDRTAMIGVSARHSTKTRTPFSDEATPERAVLEKEKFQQLEKAIRLLTDPSASACSCVPEDCAIGKSARSWGFRPPRWRKPWIAPSRN